MVGQRSLAKAGWTPFDTLTEHGTGKGPLSLQAVTPTTALAMAIFQSAWWQFEFYASRTATRMCGATSILWSALPLNVRLVKPGAEDTVDDCFSEWFE